MGCNFFTLADPHHGASPGVQDTYRHQPTQANLQSPERGQKANSKGTVYAQLISFAASPRLQSTMPDITCGSDTSKGKQLQATVVPNGSPGTPSSVGHSLDWTCQSGDWPPAQVGGLPRPFAVHTLGHAALIMM